MIIDCQRCVMYQTAHCRDCVVSALIDPPTDAAIVIDAEEERALRELSSVGLVPEIRMRRRTESA